MRKHALIRNARIIGRIVVNNRPLYGTWNRVAPRFALACIRRGKRNRDADDAARAISDLPAKTAAFSGNGFFLPWARSWARSASPPATSAPGVCVPAGWSSRGSTLCAAAWPICQLQRRLVCASYPVIACISAEILSVAKLQKLSETAYGRTIRSLWRSAPQV